MTPNEYLQESGRTNLHNEQRQKFITRLDTSSSVWPNRYVDLLHATMGISTEAGELLDVMKKYLAYGKQVDVVNIAEECGDVLWYLAIILRQIDMSFEDVMQMNINKLQVRFPEKFTEHFAVKRDLVHEREQLEADSQHLVGE